MSLVSVQNLSVTFQSGDTKVDVVRDLSFDIAQGQFVAIVGESGSGKSVTAQAIMRLLPSSTHISGQIQCDGEELTTLPESAMQRIRGKRIGMIFQEPMSALNPLHTIGRQIDEMLLTHQPDLSKSARLERLHGLLDDVGLEDFKTRLNAYPHQLSGGERQRVMIAMAMANNPELLIADEPTTALDVTLQAQILALLKKLQKARKLSVLMITHDLTIVQHLADRVIVMQHGTLVESGQTQNVFDAPKQAHTKQLLSAIPKGSAVPLAADASALLACEKLSVFYQKKQSLFARKSAIKAAVKEASFSLKSGETLGLVGESGSGKSSLGLALLRLIQSDGPIVYLGQDISTLNGRALRPLRADLQIVFQDPYASLNPRMTIEQIVGEGLRVHQPHLSKAQRRVHAEQTLISVGLEPEMLSRYAHEFSGGQRQRISIARAMILAPKLVVLDEPTSALDVSVQAQVLELLKKFQSEQQVSYLFISHDLRVVRSISHRVMVMRNGEIIEHQETENLFESAQHDYTRTLIETSLKPI
jgi:microcin C transport system ATP-binding protein